MPCKFNLSDALTVLFAVLILFSVDPCQAQHYGHAQNSISPTRASDLYMDYDRTQSCPNCNNEIPCLDLYGFKGQPYSDKRPGGCQCGKKKGLTWYNAYHHWPNPWSVLMDHGRDGYGWGKYTDTTCPRKRDCLDILADVRIACPVRKDSGYFGPHCEPYGLLGKSRSGVVTGEENPAKSTTESKTKKPAQAGYFPQNQFRPIQYPVPQQVVQNPTPQFQSPPFRTAQMHQGVPLAQQGFQQMRRPVDNGRASMPPNFQRNYPAFHTYPPGGFTRPSSNARYPLNSTSSDRLRQAENEWGSTRSNPIRR